MVCERGTDVAVPTRSIRSIAAGLCAARCRREVRELWDGFGKEAGDTSRRIRLRVARALLREKIHPSEVALALAPRPDVHSHDSDYIARPSGKRLRPAEDAMIAPAPAAHRGACAS